MNRCILYTTIFLPLGITIWYAASLWNENGTSIQSPNIKSAATKREKVSQKTRNNDEKEENEIDDELTKPKYTGELKARKIFEKVQRGLIQDPPYLKQGVFVFVVKKDGADAAEFVLDLSKSTVTEGASPLKADVTITLEDDVLAGLVDGSLNPLKGFLLGKLQVKGDFLLAKELHKLFKITDVNKF